MATGASKSLITPPTPPPLGIYYWWLFSPLDSGQKEEEKEKVVLAANDSLDVLTGGDGLVSRSAPPPYLPRAAGLTANCKSCLIGLIWAPPAAATSEMILIPAPLIRISGTLPKIPKSNVP